MELGEDILSIATHLLFRIVAAVIVLGILFIFVSNVRQGESFEKQSLATDLALITDTLPLAEGTVSLSYSPPSQIEGLSVALQESSVRVFKGEKDPGVVRSFAIDKNLVYEKTVLKFKEKEIVRIQIKKEGNRISWHKRG